jgi:hypothetical protein
MPFQIQRFIVSNGKSDHVLLVGKDFKENFMVRFKLKVEVFWVVIQCSVAVGYQSFGGPFCFHLQAENA